MKKKSGLSLALLFIFGCVFLFSCWQVVTIFAAAKKEEREFERLSHLVEETEDGEPEKGQSQSPYRALKEKNPDFFGWICVEDTVLDYPVMYTPEYPEYYLHRNFEKAYSKSGVPFLDGSCYEGCGNYLIYGHNMKNGAMFASLLKYADSKYWERHPALCFDTPGRTGEYQVLAAFYTEIYPKDAEGVFRYYEYTELCSPRIFDEYLEQVRKAALYDTGVEAFFGEEILTLSTCSYHKENGRFVVVAVRKEN